MNPLKTNISASHVDIILIEDVNNKSYKPKVTFGSDPDAGQSSIALEAFNSSKEKH